MGRQTCQTVLSVLAGTGERSSGVPVANWAAGLGVCRSAFLEAQGRMKRARHDLSPPAALAACSYVYSARKTRSDATPPELQAMKSMRDFWHTDDVSRALGSSDENRKPAMPQATLGGRSTHRAAKERYTDSSSSGRSTSPTRWNRSKDSPIPAAQLS